MLYNDKDIPEGTFPNVKVGYLCSENHDVR